jgi:hypothetical protein
VSARVHHKAGSDCISCDGSAASPHGDRHFEVTTNFDNGVEFTDFAGYSYGEWGYAIKGSI